MCQTYQKGSSPNFSPGDADLHVPAIKISLKRPDIVNVKGDASADMGIPLFKLQNNIRFLFYKRVHFFKLF
jgi:hypothetical protein